jgi:hypothetical protein
VGGGVGVEGVGGGGGGGGHERCDVSVESCVGGQSIRGSFQTLWLFTVCEWSGVLEDSISMNSIIICSHSCYTEFFRVARRGALMF